MRTGQVEWVVVIALVLVTIVVSAVMSVNLEKILKNFFKPPEPSVKAETFRIIPPYVTLLFNVLMLYLVTFAFHLSQMVQIIINVLLLVAAMVVLIKMLKKTLPCWQDH